MVHGRCAGGEQCKSTESHPQYESGSGGKGRVRGRRAGCANDGSSSAFPYCGACSGQKVGKRQRFIVGVEKGMETVKHVSENSNTSLVCEAASSAGAAASTASVSGGCADGQAARNVVQGCPEMSSDVQRCSRISLLAFPFSTTRTYHFYKFNKDDFHTQYKTSPCNHKVYQRRRSLSIHISLP